MDPKTRSEADPQDADQRDADPQEITLTLEDVAHFADGTGDLPADTAGRLRAMILCEDSDEIEYTWRCQIAPHLEDLRRMADDAGVETLVDGLYISQWLERLRSRPWQKPEDVFHANVDVPYQELINMACALAGRAGGDERAELRLLSERLITAVDDHLGGDKIVELLFNRLVEIGRLPTQRCHPGHAAPGHRQRLEELAAPLHGGTDSPFEPLLPG